MDQITLDAILYRHHKWLRGMAGGERADLTRADLTRADLTRANLTDANLTDADLTDADLTRANLTDADLTRADLTRANLTRANLTRADLGRAKEDIFSILDSAPREVPGLLQALRDGKIDGSVYRGSCACLVGTIANIRGVDYLNLEGIQPNGSRPAERWFLAIRENDAPGNSVIAKITEEWIEEWMSKQPEEAAAE